MSSILGYASLVTAIFLAFPVQEMIPPIAALQGARLLLAPALFIYGALAFPIPPMLGLAILTGLLSDLAYLHVVSGQVEIGLGWSIVFYVIMGLVANGFRPMFLRGHWWISAPLAILATSLFLALQFTMISFRREGFYFDQIVLWRVFGPGLMAGTVILLVHLVAWQIGGFIPGSRRHFSRFSQA